MILKKRGHQIPENEFQPDYIDLVKLSRVELEALKNSYNMKIKEREEKSLITFFSKKFKTDLRKLLRKLIKYEMIFFVSWAIFFVILITIANYIGWMQEKGLSNTIFTILFVPMIISMIPFVITAMLLDDRTSSDRGTLDRINTILESKYNTYDRLISPETPFANELHYIETIRSCKNNIYLIDKYFNEAGLRLINEGIKDKTDISIIKIITSPDKTTEGLKNSFLKLKDELKTRNINITLRVLCDKEGLNSIHDRYLITSDMNFLLPSPDVVKRGQYASITGINQHFPFEKYWDVSLDIIQDWNKIKEHLK